MQTGGTVTLSGALYAGYGGGTGTYQLGGGTLQTPFVASGSGTGTFNFSDSPGGRWTALYRRRGGHQHV